MKKVVKAICATWIILFLQQKANAANAECEMPAIKPKSPNTQYVNQALALSWHSSSLSQPENYTEIKFSVADDGKIYEPQITHPSDLDQYDAECLEAVCTLSPLSRFSDNYSSRLQHVVIKFGGTDGLKPTLEAPETRKYLHSHLQPKDRNESFVVVHRIPLTVLTRYPGYFTNEELQNESNLMPVYVGFTAGASYAKTIPNLYAYWDHLFKSPNVTKDDIRQWASGAKSAAK